jgi:hypothetical protein
MHEKSTEQNQLADASARFALLLLFMSATFAACGSNKLSTAEAERVIAQYPKIADVGASRVEAVSQAEGSNEAIVRVALSDARFNAKLRRYDSGWQWEFVETTAGGSMPPDRAIADLYEGQRLKRAAAWAKEHASQYESTISAVDRYSENMPRRTDWAFTVIEWNLLRKGSAEAYRTFSPSVERAKIADSLETPASDAWGSEILLNFDGNARRATFVSNGADGTKGTADDVICLVIGAKAFDDFYDKVMWDYTKVWKLPEGLQSAIDAVVKEPANRKAEFSRVVQ